MHLRGESDGQMPIMHAYEPTHNRGMGDLLDNHMTSTSTRLTLTRFPVGISITRFASVKLLGHDSLG